MGTKQLWELQGNTLVWKVTPGEVHSDNYEMSGLYVDAIIGYGVSESGTLWLERTGYFPTLRTIPNDTHATLEVTVPPQQAPALLLDGQAATEYPQEFRLDGTLTVSSRTETGVTVTRQFFPASESLCFVETVTVTAQQPVTVSVDCPAETVLGHTTGTKGVYVSRVCHTAEQTTLAAGESYTYAVYVSATIADEPHPLPDATAELAKRYDRVAALCDRSLRLDTGLPELDGMMRFARLRAGESIFQTLGGKFHSPGGRRYYAAIWCNDQVEYAGPYFAMTGDRTAIEASLNAYRAYVPFMTDEYKPIPSSIIAEGLDIWAGAGDRGDAAMYLYGASLFCLYLGDEQVARELYAPIQWCAEYCERKRSPEGVIRSDSDELEGRFPTDGYANLSTSCLCYGGLIAAAKLADSLGDVAAATLYRQRAAALREAVERYFGAELHGFATYRYSKGYDTLRAWICLPLCMGITERKEGTLAAMLSPYLWTEEGMLTCELSPENTNDTIWDRSTLYGMRCAFFAGHGYLMLPHLLRYCRKRLLCDRVPYAVEAYPEGDKRQLSGESALFGRIAAEGLLAIQPEGLGTFSFVPSLPADMPHLRLSGVYIGKYCYDIAVERNGWSVQRDGVVIATGPTTGQRITVY